MGNNFADLYACVAQGPKFSFSDRPQGKHVEEADIDGEITGIGATALPRG
jgi:hypothetical protein